MILDAVFLWVLVINDDSCFRNVKDLERYNSTSEPIKVFVFKGVLRFKVRLFYHTDLTIKDKYMIYNVSIFSTVDNIFPCFLLTRSHHISV